MMHVLDSSALLAELQGEDEAIQVRDLLRGASQGKAEILMTEFNYGEVLYVVGMRQGLERMAEVRNVIGLLPIKLVPVTREMVESAAKIKVEHPVAFGDAFVVALALDTGAVVVTQDRDFGAVRKEVEIEWLR